VAELGLVVVATGAIDFLMRSLGIVYKKLGGLVFVRKHQKMRRGGLPNQPMLTGE
jgi:hypothetical protein